MKRSGFKQLTYAESLEKRRKYEETRAQKSKSAAAQAGEKRSKTSISARIKMEWEWKLAVRTRDDFTCKFPGCRHRYPSIHCHHIAPRSQRKDLIYVVDNGACLCAAHHQWVHDNPKQAVSMKLLSNRSKELAEKEGTIGVR